jgi:hypothetical protein
VAKDYANKLGTFREFKMLLNNVDILNNPNWVSLIGNYYIAHYGMPNLDEQDIYAATHVYMGLLMEFLYSVNTKTVNEALKYTEESLYFELRDVIEGDYPTAVEYIRGLEKMIRNRELKILRKKPNVRNVYHVTL